MPPCTIFSVLIYRTSTLIYFICSIIIYDCMYACMYVCMYVYMHACMYVCMYIYICMYICMYVCVYASAYLKVSFLYISLFKIYCYYLSMIHFHLFYKINHHQS